MGAVAPPFRWIPEDDILLRNAIEAGASLESLAKGAVQFSRRFTVQELQDRWYSLLYDPIVSEEAATHMIEFENSTSTILKPNRLENRRETSCILGKRKSKSIRKSYYAMRKRISSQPFGVMDVNFLGGPGHMNYRDGNEPQSAICMTENPLPDDFDFQDPNFDFTDSFQEFATCDVEPTGHGVYPPVNDHVEHPPFHGNDDSLSFCPTSGEDITLPENHNEFPVFDHSENLDANVTSEFEGTSFQDFGYSSPLPQMPTWSATEGISEPTLPFQLEEKDLQTGDSFLFPNGGDADPMPCDNMNNLTDLTDSTKEYFEQLSSTLFDFTNEELQLMDADGNDTIDKSYFDGFSSLLLDSPNFSVSEGSLTPDGQIPVISTIPCPIDMGKGPFHPDNQTCLRKAEVSTNVSRVKLFGPEYRDGVICCTLNTEDQEVPSNDDVFLPFRCPSPSYPTGANQRLHDAYYPYHSGGRDFTSTQKETGGPSLIKNERRESCARPQILGLPRQSDMGLKHPIRDNRVKYELPNSNMAVRNVKNNEGQSQTSSVNAAIMDQGKNLDQSTSVPCLNRHTCGQDSLKIPIDCKKEVHATVPNNGETKTVLSSMEMVGQEAIELNTLSDEEELYSESDFEVPYFSDVEAMILEMDLSPDDYAWQSSQKVLRYQDDETKRTIIRLEQAADTHTQRAMAARGALAVLYGRRSKHFIKKPQVLLGRSTEDFQVDIDLGREGRANKISRRQAMIEMDPNGVFRMKNLGKISIHVNGKEVAPRQSVNLTSECLIEVKRLSFVFESSQTCIKQQSVDGGSFS